jgi:hypothetical protein
MHEIFHNVLATLYQQKQMGEAFYKDSWLYSGGEEKLYENARIAFDKGLTDVGGAGHLIQFFYMLLVKSMGEAGLIELYRRYRRVSNSESFVAEEHPAMDLLSEAGRVVGNVDFSAAMQYVGASPSQRQVIENSFSSASPVYPLYLLVTESSLKPIQNQLKLRSPLDLVSCKDLRVTGLKSSVLFNFSPEIYRWVIGKCFLIRDGFGAARVVKIDNEMVFVEGLPVGKYALQLPTDKYDNFCPISNYVAVTEKASSFDCLYSRKKASALANQTIFFNGYSGVFCKISVEISEGRLVVDVVGERPHSLFPGVVYAQFVVKNQNGTVVFALEMFGGKTELLSKSIPISAGFSIEVYHLEPAGLKVSNSQQSAVIDNNAKINVLAMTDMGLVNRSLATDAGKNLKLEVEKCAAAFDESPHLALHDEYPIKQDLRMAINMFSLAVRGELFERYRTIEFTRPPESGVLSGRALVWFLYGHSDREVGRITMNSINRSVTFEVHDGKPHDYFLSVFLSVVLRSAEGDVIYCRELCGNTLAVASKIDLSFELGCTLSVMHREPVRNHILDSITGQKTLVGRVQHVTQRSLGRLSLSSYG